MTVAGSFRLASPSSRREAREPGKLDSSIRRLLGAAAGVVALPLVILTFDLDGGSASTGDVDAELVGYSLGHQIGMDLVRQGRSVDLDAVGRGLRDGRAGRDSVYPADEIEALLAELKRGIQETQRADRVRGRPTLRRTGEAFMAENARREGVVVLPSGLQYRVIRPGQGRRPAPADTVRIRYRSTRLDGTAFHDSTGKEHEPETLRVGSLIGGLRELLPSMAEGARWEIFLTPDHAFGRRGPLADQTVVYDLELIAVVPADGASSEPED